MYEQICRLLVDNGAQLIYTTDRAAGKALEALKGVHPVFHSETSINEKIAFELALTGGMTGKRTACIFSTEGLYDALDPLMSSAYTGTAGGFVVLSIQETEEEVTPIGLFSKLPLLTAEDPAMLARSVEFGYSLSEKYEIPVIIQTAAGSENARSPFMNSQNQRHTKDNAGSLSDGSMTLQADKIPATGGRHSNFIKNPARWAATPKFRYQLHRLLNEKIEKIREEFEEYDGNSVKNMSGGTGIITDKRAYAEFYGEDTSVLYISTVYPLPVKMVETFVNQKDNVFLIEGEYPVIELQIRDRTKVKTERINGMTGKEKPVETMYGLEVVRDTLGGASSISIAHGIKKSCPDKKIIAITFEDHFLHSGMPAFVNTLYNNSSCIILILVNEGEDQIRKIIDGCGFSNYFHIDSASEIERFADADALTVLFCKGII